VFIELDIERFPVIDSARKKALLGLLYLWYMSHCCCCLHTHVTWRKFLFLFVGAHPLYIMIMMEHVNIWLFDAIVVS